MSNKNKKVMNNRSVFGLCLLSWSVMAATTAFAQDASDAAMPFFKNHEPKAQAVASDQGSAVSVYNLTSQVVEDGSTEIKIHFNSFPVEPKSTKNDDKNQLILDFGRVNLDLKKNVGHTSTEQVLAFKLAKNAKGDSILAIALGEYGSITTKKTDNAYILKIHPKKVQSLASTSFAPTGGVEGVALSRTKGGEDQAVIQLTTTNTPVSIKQVGGKVVATFKGSKFPASQIKEQAFNDVRAIITKSKVYNNGADGVVELTPSGSFEYMAIQVEKTLTINFAKKAQGKSMSSTVGLNGERYVGRKISMDFQNVEVRKVLQLLAGYTGVNIVASDNVTGNISLRLQDVPWDQALSIITKTKALAQRKDGNVIWVAPIEEVDKHEANEAKAYAQAIKLAPLESAFIQLNYAVAADVAALIRMENTSEKGMSYENRQLMLSRLNVNESEGSLLSPRGSVTFDARTNMLIVNDTSKKVEEIKRIITQIDIPVQQVVVEARIVRATTNFSKSIGVKWGLAKDSSQSISGNMTNLYNSSRYGKANEADAVDSNVNLDLGQTVGTSSIAFGLINTTNTLLALELSALQSDGQGEVLSTPKVMTGDKQEATIRSGVKLPYQSTDDEGATTTIFQDAVIELTVTPSITPDGTVQMKLSINKDTQGQLTDAGYAIDTNQLTTNVLVNNGETVVLGGLYEDSKTNTVQKVPVLGSMPVIGKLFRSKGNTESKQELLIFITPNIVENAGAKP